MGMLIKPVSYCWRLAILLSLGTRKAKMADALATVAIETLRDLLVEEVKFLSGVSDQVEQVQRDLKTMHSLLKDADKWSNRNDSASLRDWIANLKKLASDAENVLEEYAFKVTSKTNRRNLKEKLERYICVLSECYNVHKVGKEIKGITSRLANLTKSLESISGGRGSSNSADDEQRMLRQTYAHQDVQHFVGMEEDIEHLISKLKDDNTSSPVISICGMGGLGKTTLARKVYSHKDLHGCFEARAWVCVTQQFQPKSVLSQILKQVHREESNNMEFSELVVQLHNVLMLKKCLIVIDDIWEPEHWNRIEPAFPTNCKVVLTTRTENIVSQEYLYKLDFLTEDQGWELLQKIAIPKNDEPGSRSLEDIGRQIVKKCGHLPLAISVIGGVLRQNPGREAEWEKVSGNIDSYMKHGEGVGSDTRVKQVLDLSYEVLPYYLKPCFLYLGCFPEDSDIEAEELYLLWIGEGLISSEDKGRNETLRDVAERYLRELAFRCMVQLNEEIVYGQICCRLHDLMRELCSSKAKEVEFFRCIDTSKKPDGDGAPPARRLAFHVVEDGTTLSIQEFKDVRSFLVFSKCLLNRYDCDFSDGGIDFEKSKYLRVLKLEGCRFKNGKLPSQVGKLIYLRYLSLYFSKLKKLPRFVCDMPYLQILDLRGWVDDPIKVPNLIWKMKKLRHLFLGSMAVIGGQELRLDGLKELETLECWGDGRICIADIPKLTNLRELGIHGVSDMDSLSIIADHMSDNQTRLRKTSLLIVSCDFSSEEGMEVLKNILMSGSLIYLDMAECKFSRTFPCYQQGMCKNLRVLRINSDSIIGEDLMEKFGAYPALRSLTLSQMVVTTKIICHVNSFPELELLSLWSVNLKEWEVEEKAMPKLTELFLYRCDNLEMIPDGLRFISTLQKLESRMPRKFNNRLRVVDGQPGDDYNKVRPIPSLDLDDLEAEDDEDIESYEAEDDEIMA